MRKSGIAQRGSPAFFVYTCKRVGAFCGYPRTAFGGLIFASRIFYAGLLFLSPIFTRGNFPWERGFL